MLSVRGSDKLRAAALAVKVARRDVRNDIARATRQTMNPVWRSAVESHARTTLDARVIAKGARIAAGNPPAAVAATSTRALSGGLVPAKDWQGFEFGSDRNKTTTYERRVPSGGTTKVTRHASRQMPARYRTGRVAYAAVEVLAPRLAALWVSIIVRKFNDAVEKGE